MPKCFVCRAPATYVCADLQGYKNFVVKLENELEEAKPADRNESK
jgi:hypothetical protein